MTDHAPSVCLDDCSPARCICSLCDEAPGRKYPNLKDAPLGEQYEKNPDAPESLFADSGPGFPMTYFNIFRGVQYRAGPPAEVSRLPVTACVEQSLLADWPCTAGLALRSPTVAGASG